MEEVGTTGEKSDAKAVDVESEKCKTNFNDRASSTHTVSQAMKTVEVLSPVAEANDFDTDEYPAKDEISKESLKPNRISTTQIS